MSTQILGPLAAYSTTLAWRPLATDLPIFRADQPDRGLFYAPGYLVVTRNSQTADLERQLLSGTAPSSSAFAATLRQYAQTAYEVNQSQVQQPFAPVCLTLYLNLECNLHCRYCYAMPSPEPAARLSLNTVGAAAEIVAANCVAQGRPLTVVFHGGGEPTLDQALADAALDAVEAVAAAHQLDIMRYIATNGVISPQKARWLAERFDLIGLSCDGPPTIQNAQRPRWGGGSSSDAVARTAQIVRDAGKPLHVRVTLTAETIACQPEIATYLCEQLAPSEIHVEPIYQVGRAATQEKAIEDAEAFVDAFWRAHAIAAGWGIRWLTSGSRPGEVHGAYCHIFRQVLQLVPGDAATTCFRITTATEARATGSLIGEASLSGYFHLDAEPIDRLRAELMTQPEHCGDCFNQYHCVRGCPEFCPLQDQITPDAFRCRVQQLLVSSLLQRVGTAILNDADIAGQVIHL